MPPIKSNFHRYDMENMIEADNVISYKKKKKWCIKFNGNI